MIKCAVFDLDGTLTDTLDTIAYYCNKALKRLGLEPIETEKYKYFVGEGAAKLIHRILNYRGLSLTAEEEEKITKEYVEDYNRDPKFLTKVYDGVEELLYFLKEKGILLAVLSNKPESSVKPLVSDFFEDGVFSIVCGQKDSVPKKPDPTALFSILKELGCEAKECIYVGDTSTDMKTGKAAGAYTVGVLWGFRDIEELQSSGADLIAENPMQIAERI